MLYRGLSKTGYKKQNLMLPLKTKRIPSNIPYVVDNILEWLRPCDMPSRRYSVYASPSKDLAMKYATDNSIICSVRFNKEYKAVQLTNYEDAKFHPDIKFIQKEVISSLGQDWIDSPLVEKIKCGLFLPALEKEDVDKIFKELNLNTLKETLLNKSTFWKDVKKIKHGETLTNGEVFFETQDGYFLDEVF